MPSRARVRSGRTVLGSAVALVLGALAFVLRLGGLLFRQLEEVLVGLYDAVIAVPLVLERAVRARSGGGHGQEPPTGRTGRSKRGRKGGTPDPEVTARSGGSAGRGASSRKRPAGAPAIAEKGA